MSAHGKGPAGGAFGRGGSGSGWTPGRLDRDRYGRGPQRRYTSINEGDIIEVTRAEQSRSGSDLTCGLGAGKRVFFPQDQGKGVKPGWSGKVKITRQHGNPNFYDGVAIYEEAKEAEVVQPAATIDTKFEPTEPPEKKYEAKETISIGDLGATQKDAAVVYVDAKARDMPVLQALEYLIRNGSPASAQGQSILEAMKAHLESGRPIYEVAESIPDESKKLGFYLDQWKEKESLSVGVGEKVEKVKTPAAADVVDKKKAAADVSVTTTRKKRRDAPMPVHTGGRKGGASTLGILISAYRTNLYRR